MFGIDEVRLTGTMADLAELAQVVEPDLGDTGEMRGAGKVLRAGSERHVVSAPAHQSAVARVLGKAVRVAAPAGQERVARAVRTLRQEVEHLPCGSGFAVTEDGVFLGGKRNECRQVIKPALVG